MDFNGQDSYIHLRYGIVSGFLTYKKHFLIGVCLQAGQTGH